MDLVSIIFYIIGGLSIFIYGMKILSEGLQKTAGNELKSILERLTNNKLKGVAVGAMFTSIVQSSSLTTVTVVGLISGGVMTLESAVPVIMGANIGTTITAQIIAFKVTQLAFPAMAIGLLLMNIRKGKYSGVGNVFMGFGLLFLGMILMGQGILPLKADDGFHGMLLSFAENPLMGLLVALLFTAIIQSSSATTALVVAMSAEGLLPLASALPLILGANIGTCITSVLASLGASLSARRAALVHVMFNVIGVLIFLPLLPMFADFISGTDGDVARQVANAHVVFNISTTLLLVPFSGLLIVLVKKILPGEEIKIDDGTKFINNNLLGTPSLAISQARKEAEYMGGIVVGMMKDARKLIMDDKLKYAKAIKTKEASVDKIYMALDNFLKDVSEHTLSDDQSLDLSILIHSISDIERTSDHINSLAEHGQKKLDKNLKFSKMAMKELEVLFKRSEESIEEAIRVLSTKDRELAKNVLHLEAEIDVMKESFIESHILRLEDGICNNKSGPTYLSIIGHLERISDHAHNIVNVVMWGF